MKQLGMYVCLLLPLLLFLPVRFPFIHDELFRRDFQLLCVWGKCVVRSDYWEAKKNIVAILP